MASCRPCCEPRISACSVWPSNLCCCCCCCWSVCVCVSLLCDVFVLCFHLFSLPRDASVMYCVLFYASFFCFLFFGWFVLFSPLSSSLSPHSHHPLTLIFLLFFFSLLSLFSLSLFPSPLSSRVRTNTHYLSLSLSFFSLSDSLTCNSRQSNQVGTCCRE